MIRILILSVGSFLGEQAPYSSSPVQISHLISKVWLGAPAYLFFYNFERATFCYILEICLVFFFFFFFSFSHTYIRTGRNTKFKKPVIFYTNFILFFFFFSTEMKRKNGFFFFFFWALCWGIYVYCTFRGNYVLYIS